MESQTTEINQLNFRLGSKRVDYLRFLINRKPDRKFGILPNLTVSAALVLSVSVAVFLTYYYADAVYYEWFRSTADNRDRSSIFYLTTDIGKLDWLLWSSGSVVLLTIAFHFTGAATALVVRWHHLFLKACFVFTSIAFSGLVAIGLKILIGRGRPAVTGDDPETWNTLSFFGALESSGFPSGHSTTIGALGMVLTLLTPRLGIAFIPIVIWVGVSRLVVGAHFPSDVVAGLSLGVIFTWLHARHFARKRLLFEFGQNGRLRLRNIAAKRARRKASSRVKSKGFLGLNSIITKSF